MAPDHSKRKFATLEIGIACMQVMQKLLPCLSQDSEITCLSPLFFLAMLCDPAVSSKQLQPAQQENDIKCFFMSCDYGSKMKVIRAFLISNLPIK